MYDAATSPALASRLTADDLRESFAPVVPVIRKRARYHFRDVPCGHQRDDAEAETVAVAWNWFVRLNERGKNPTGFMNRLIRYAILFVRGGRRLCGSSSTDVLSPMAQMNKGFTVVFVPSGSKCAGRELDDSLRVSRQTPPSDRASFSIDFARWRSRLPQRERRILDDLKAGEKTSDVARKYGITAARISQFRRQFEDGWKAFQGGAEPGSVPRAS